MTRTTIPLTEYVPRQLPAKAISYEVGRILRRDYNSQIQVESPSLQTDEQWRLTPQGWVGYIPVTPELGLQLRPKVELGNLFRMLEYAYRLNSFRFLEDLTACQKLEDFYEHLASVLAKRVLDRARKGFHRAYMPESQHLPYVRGRMDVQNLIYKPWSARLHCHYEEHTADVEENQLLAWTLRHIARSNLCSQRVQPTVRHAYRSLSGLAALHPFTPQDCVGRLYNRLNQDYHPMHALCRFFLEHSGPSHEIGDRTVLPFLVNMERLFELFVAEWLQAHLSSDFLLMVQEKVDIGEQSTLHFNIDLVLIDAETGKTYCVLDTKYKANNSPSASDVAQVVAYAEMKGCDRAILVYPTTLSKPLDERVGKIRVQSMTFSLKGDLESAGRFFLDGLFNKN